MLIRNASLIDGTGAPARAADILVDGPRVVAVEPPGRLPAPGPGQLGADELDATGLTVTPGFVDVHSHVDNAPFLAEDDTSKILQGVTTEVSGNCGFSLAPRPAETAGAFDSMSSRIFPPVPWSWHTFGEFLQVTDERGYVTNNAPLVGHNALRLAVLGMSNITADAEAVRAMGVLLEEALEAGAVGLSSGLAYPPGVFSTSAELSELARRLPDKRPYVSHVRGESTQLRASLAEALEVGRLSGRPVQISHLKCAGRGQWGAMPSVLAVLDQARDAGLHVRQDVYPYTASSTMLTATLPPWFQEGGKPSVLARLATAAALDRLRADIGRDAGTWENPVYNAGWDGVVVASSASGEFDGVSLAGISERLGLDPFDALVRVLRDEQLQASMIVHSMHEDDLDAVLCHPMTMIGSDGLPPGLPGKPHPRVNGTFPRVLARYVRERGVLDLAEAVRRMTALGAEMYGLRDRGRVAPGLAADLVAFDPAAVCDRATFEDPNQEPVGIAWVMLNGDLVVRDGVYQGHRSGIRLTPA